MHLRTCLASGRPAILEVYSSELTYECRQLHLRTCLASGRPALLEVYSSELTYECRQLHIILPEKGGVVK